MKMRYGRISKWIALTVTLAMACAFSMPSFAESGISGASGQTPQPVVIEDVITPENIDAEPSASGFIDRGVDFSAVNDYEYGEIAVSKGKSGLLRSGSKHRFRPHTIIEGHPM